MRISIVVPVYNFDGSIPLLQRNLNSIFIQTFKDYEVIVTDDTPGNEIYDWLVQYTQATGLQIEYCRNPNGKGMAKNTNYGIDQAKGELIKILFQDDYFYDYKSLGYMESYFTPTVNWLATGCIHTYDGQTLFNPHEPYYSKKENTIGSPSVTMFRREIQERFDPQFDWVLDLDLYRRIQKRYGLPKTLKLVNVVIGLHPGQMTNQLSDERKAFEFELLNQKYESTTHRN